MTLYINAEKIQHDDSPIGLRDSVDAVCIVWIVVWGGWWDEDTILGCEIASTYSTSIGPLGDICWFIFKLESQATLKVVGREPVNEFMVITNMISSHLIICRKPDSQKVLGCLYVSRDIASISTECPHQWRIVSIAIPHLYVIWSPGGAIDIHPHKRNVDISSVWLWDEVGTLRIIRVGVGEWRRCQDATSVRVGATTFGEQFQGGIF